MQPIPLPEVLDPSRVSHRNHVDSGDYEQLSELLADALQQTCEYAQQLWHDLDRVRGYLLASLPPDPRTPAAHPTTATSPTGPDDEAGWENWISAYATVSSVLCGPQGDSGFGLGEARREAQLRRTAPVLQIPIVHKHPDTPAGPAAPSQADQSRSDSTRLVRAGAAAIVLLLAVRGLRSPRPRR